MKKNFALLMVVFLFVTMFAFDGVDKKESLLKVMDEETVDNIMRTLWLYDTGKYDFNNLSDAVLDELLQEKNYNSKYEERMRYRLNDMLKNPDTYTPSYENKYKTFLKYIENISPHEAYVLSDFFGLDSNRDYEEIPPVADMQFPRDHSPQYDFQVGWHFFVGNCLDKNGIEYGVQLMFWRYSIFPPDLAKMFGLSDEENQLIEYHFAISRAGDKHYSAKPTVIGGTTGLLSFTDNPFTYKMGENKIYSLQGNSFAPIRLVAKGWDDTANEVEIEIGITVGQSKQPVLNGDNGAAPSIGGVGTLYYSITNMPLISDDSYIIIDGEKIELSEGKFWFDHQWANGLMPAGNPRDILVRVAKCLSAPTPSGWDWFMVQFDDDTEMGLSAIHSTENLSFYYQKGDEPPETMTADVEGKYVDEDGTAIDITGKLIVSEWIQANHSPDPEKFWVTNVWYPNRWEFIFQDKNVPESKSHFYMKPIVDNGQYAFFASGAQYSEGGTYILNEKKEMIGKGFAESVAYADTTVNMVNLTGMPYNDEVKKAIKSPKISKELEADCMKYIYNSPHKDMILKLLGK
jgi:predicted secreted hydrolase